MRQKKSSKVILIVIIVLIILILTVGFAYAYFASDVFKSNKELFFKYITQLGDEKEGFIEVPIKEYFEKQKNTPYLNNGSVSVNITTSNGQEQFENTNRMNVTFDGQVDTANSQLIQNISLNYSDSVKFPLSYKQIEENIGIQTNYIGSKYIAIDKNAMNSTSEINVKDFKKLQEITNVSLTKEELQTIQNTYFNVLNQELQDSNFSKIEEVNSKGYKLALSGENLKNLIIKLLETLRNDQTTLDKINEYIKIQKNSAKIAVSDIDNLIKEINNNSELSNQNIEIIAYQVNGKISSIIVKTNEVELQLEKTLTSNDLQYNIVLQSNNDNGSGKIGLILKFVGLKSMQNVMENYELTIESEEIKYQYNYNNNVEFTNNTSIEAFNENNTLMLNEMGQEERNNFINAIIQRVQGVNKKQMEELGLEENENPLMYVIPSISIINNFEALRK